MEITIFDGINSIGGNKIHIQHENNGIFLDFGMNYKKYNEYYEEFLKDRTTRGIHDQISLGMIPPLNIYRKDLIPSDLDISSFRDLNVDAILISHAHMDHCSNISFIDGNIPICGSPVTLALIKAIEDTSPQMEGITYFSQKEPGDDCRIIASNRKSPYKGRNLIFTEDITDNLGQFFNTKPGAKSARAKSFEPGTLTYIGDASLPFEIKAFPVDHSIYGATAYSVSKDDNTVIYTGDIRLHGGFKYKTEAFVKEAKKLSPKALIVEGTRTSRMDEYESEEEVYRNSLAAVEAAKGLVIADFSPRNFERLDTFMKIAEKTGRELIITPKDAYMLHALACTGDTRRLNNLKIYRELKAKIAKWESEVVEAMYGEKYIDIGNIQTNSEKYIICFSFFDLKHLLDIKPTFATYIYSSSEAFTEEQKIDFIRLKNWLDFFNIDLIGFKIVEEGGTITPRFEKGYHASGHASGGELIKIIEEIDPDLVIPIHTENGKFFQENLNQKVIIPQSGITIKI